MDATIHENQESSSNEVVPQMRSWRKKLTTLRRSKTEPPMPRHLIVTRYEPNTTKKLRESDHVQKCVKRSVSMKTMRDVVVVKPHEKEDDKPNEPSKKQMQEMKSPAYLLDEIEENDENDTPRSGIRVSLGNMKEKLEEAEDENETTLSSGDEMCTESIGLAPKKVQKPTIIPKRKSSASLHGNTYQEFVIRPLVVDDYGPMLLRFLSWFDPIKSKNLTHPKFAEVLLERKRKRHYTLVAVSSETGRFISMGSMIIVDNIFGPNYATGIVDSLLIHPDYQGTMLFDKLLIRLKEVAEMIPDVQAVRVDIEGKFGLEVIGDARSYKKLGRAYEMNLEKINRFKY